MTIQPIETRYAGYRFRSRLEARWAVFFDTLDIKWEYEPQGYVIDGTPYLPDFKLEFPGEHPASPDDATGAWVHGQLAALDRAAPEYGSWAWASATDRARATAILTAAERWRLQAKLKGPTVTFAEIKNSEVDEHEGQHVDLCRSLARESGYPVLLLTGVPAHRMYHQFTPDLQPDAFTAAFFHDYGPKLTTADEYWFQAAELSGQTGVFEFVHDERGLAKSFGKGLVKAVQAARSARFEHGESP